MDTAQYAGVLLFFCYQPQSPDEAFLATLRSSTVLLLNFYRSNIETTGFQTFIKPKQALKSSKIASIIQLP